MRRVLFFLNANRRILTLFVALFLSVLMMSMGRGPKENFARSVTTTIFNTGRWTFSWGIYMLDLWHENERLRLQNLELSYQINFSRTAQQENERLLKLLKFKETHSFKVISANVIGHDLDLIVNSVVLDVGSRDGVKKYMTVVTAEGLVGRIIEVFPTSCSVQILKDYNSRISAVINGERPTEGIVRWEGGPYLCLYGLEHLSKPGPGQTVYTTGIGGTFPSGLLIGTVADKQEGEMTIYASVNIKPAVDFSKVQEVFILSGSERSDIWNDNGGSGYFLRPEIQ
jgi:rod shape-determining protein MreC